MLYRTVTATLAALLLVGGCQSAYYKTMEKIGYHKRDLLVGNVEDARDAQEDAKEEFTSALEQFRSVVQFDGDELEDIYKRLRRALDRSEDRAQTVHKRVDEVEQVAEALFDEWEAELSEYASTELRRASERQLDQTRARYRDLISAMHRAEGKLEPVLSPMRDHVLFLKHNLNAQAIAAIENEVDAIELQVSALIEDMERAIAEADKFIDAMEG